MRIALIDDLDEERNLAGNYLKEYAAGKKLMMEIDSFESGEAFLSSFVPYQYDIVFMDIYMGGITGVETALKMRESDSHTLLIFLTSSGEHMADAFGAHAFDYLEKPVTMERLARCMEDAMKLLPKPEEYLTFTAGGTDIRIFYKDIAYLLSNDHSTLIHCITGQEYTPYSSFSAFTKPLSSEPRFLLVSRGVLVNMDYVTGFTERECLLQGNLSVPITLRKQKQLEQAWHSYDFAKLHRESAERSHSR